MDLHQMAQASRQAALELACASVSRRNTALTCMAERLKNHQNEIFAANQADLAQAEQEGLAAPPP